MKYKTSLPHFPKEDIAEILPKISDILEGKGFLSMGDNVKEFESSFAAYTGSQGAVATNSCSSALEISLNALGVGSGDEVIVPVQTFIATGSSVVRAGAKPIFCDINKNLLIDFDDLKNKITKFTKAVVIVHFAGLIHEDIINIRKFLNKKGIFLIEDAAHAAGSSLNGVKAGNFGDLSCFSFFSTKNMTTGEGGMIISNDGELLKLCSSIRNRGLDLDSPLEQFINIGSNNRMTEIQALLGIYQLNRLEEFNLRRNRIAEIYNQELTPFLNSNVLSRNIKTKDNISSYWKYWISLEEAYFNSNDRLQIKEEMRALSIPIDWAYSPLLHLQPVFRRMYNINEGYLPVSEEIARRHICLPIHALIEDEDALFIIKKFAGIVSSILQANKENK
jgi:perosamine synthetase